MAAELQQQAEAATVMAHRRRMYHACIAPVAASVILALAGCTESQPVATRQYSLRVADAALTSGAPEMALRVSDIILRKDPHDVAALTERADAIYELGLMTQSRAAYRLALASDPRAVKAQIGLGRTLVRSDPRAAETAFRAALAIEPRNATALNNLGITLHLLGRSAEAQECFRQALAAAPDMAEVKVNLGLELALSGHTGEAAALVRPLADDPAATTLWRKDVAAALALAGDPNGAQEALESDPLAGGTRIAALDEPAAVPARAGHDPHFVAALAEDVPPPLAPVQTAAVIAVDNTALPPPPGADVAPPVEAALPLPPTPPETIPAEMPAGYQIQLAALDGEAIAQAHWERLLARLPKTLEGHRPLVQQVEIEGRNFWRLRTDGFASHRDAQAFCQKLQAHGQHCWAV